MMLVSPVNQIYFNNEIPAQSPAHLESVLSLSGNSWKRFLSEILFYSLTLTESFLQQYPLNEIRRSLTEQSLSERQDGFQLDLFLDIFNQAIAQEHRGCFGYHATTQKHWVFNEIVKQVLEAEGHPPFPTDFYLLRAPGPTFKEFSQASAFLDRFSERKLSLEEKRRFIHQFFLQPVKEECLEYTDDQALQMYETLLFYSDVPSPLTKEEVAERAAAFIGKRTEALETWLNDPKSDDFDRTAEDHQFIIETLYPLNDSWPNQQQYLVSLNLSLFGNYTLSTESTIHVFAKGESIDLAGEGCIETAAREFLLSRGYPAEKAEEIFKAIPFPLNQGLLLQFFDDAAYSHLDDYTYLCSNFGRPLPNQKPSEFLTHFDPTAETISGGPYIFHPQLRLLMTEQTLTPSWLQIKQYDCVPLQQKGAAREIIAGLLSR